MRLIEARKPEVSPLYPLPPDYLSLTTEGMRQARVNASRLWTLPGTAEERAENLVQSTRFFDMYYLVPDYEVDHNPLFYDGTPLDTPDLHWEMSRQWATSRRNIAIAPRGSAKSTHCRRDMILRLVSYPAYSFVYATSTHDNAKFTGQTLRDQAYENGRISDDWSKEKEFAGRTKPARGEKPTGIEFFYLTNGSWCRCISAESRQRGLRPRRYRLDDPEYDSKAATQMSLVRQYMDDLLFKLVLPMVTRRECGVDWLATFVSRRHYAWHAMSLLETADGPVAEDPRFNHWSRMLIRAAYEDTSGELQSCWPTMWPLNLEDKARLGLDEDVQSLEEIALTFGSSAFNSEFMGNPGQADDSFFPELDKDRHGWWLEDIDDAYTLNPRTSTAKMCFNNKDGLQKIDMVKFLGNVRMFITVDTAFTERASSDYKCAMLMAVNKDNELFVLDLWSGRLKESILLKKSFEMAERWRCPAIHVEVIRNSYALWKKFQSIAMTKAQETLGVSYVPRIKDIRPGQTAKTSKIEALDLRFENGLVKLPFWKRHEGGWARLFDQIAEFNPDADEGGLAHDDEIDCLAMSLFVVKGRVREWVNPDAEEDPQDPYEMIRRGERTLPGGTPIALGLDLQAMPADVADILLDASGAQAKSNKGKSKV